PGMLQAIRVREAKFLVDIGAYLVAVEMHRVQARNKRIGERRLAGARQPHNENLFLLDGCRQASAGGKLGAPASLDTLHRHGLNSLLVIHKRLPCRRSLSSLAI